MNENSQPGFGKISVHGDGLGAPTPRVIERRAREIALIDERNPDEFSDADWDEARRELMGLDKPVAPEELDDRQEDADEHEYVPESAGHRSPRAGLEDDENLGEQLVAGGVEEAAHDQMVEARHEIADELRREE